MTTNKAKGIAATVQKGIVNGMGSGVYEDAAEHTAAAVYDALLVVAYNEGAASIYAEWESARVFAVLKRMFDAMGVNIADRNSIIEAFRTDFYKGCNTVRNMRGYKAVG